MDKIDLSRKMRRLTVWLETKNQPDSLVRKKSTVRRSAMPT
jgi:hypothetical protein